MKTFVSYLPDDRYTRHQPGPELRGVEMRGGGVEEDEDGLLEEGPGAGADQDHDQQRQRGVQVVLGQHIELHLHIYTALSANYLHNPHNLQYQYYIH